MHKSLRAALALPVLLLSTPSVQALDLNRALHGKYAFTYSRVCTQNSVGFTPSPQLLPLAPSTELKSTVEMIQTYKGDGTSTAIGGHMLNIFNNGSALNELEFTCTGTYQVNSDGSFSEDLSCSGTALAGNVVGQTFTQTGIRRTGRIGGLAQTLVVSNTQPNLESITFSGAGTFARICGRSGSAVKVY